jgi:hypothetical protein
MYNFLTAVSLYANPRTYFTNVSTGDEWTGTLADLDMDGVDAIAPLLWVALVGGIVPVPGFPDLLMCAGSYGGQCAVQLCSASNQELVVTVAIDAAGDNAVDIWSMIYQVHYGARVLPGDDSPPPGPWCAVRHERSFRSVLPEEIEQLPHLVTCLAWAWFTLISFQS